MATVVNNNNRTMVNNKMNMIAGLDIGNGYVKGLVKVNNGQPISVDFLSGTSLQTSDHDVKTNVNDADKVIHDIFNQMSASFDSSAVDNRIARLFGGRGVASRGSVEEFDVSGLTSKATEDLSAVLILGSMAGCVLQEYWNVNHALPSDILKVHCVKLAVALPIRDYKRDRKLYASRFTNTSHMVSIHNFESVIRVEIVIDSVEVLAEGASAQYAIVAKGPAFMDAMLTDLRQHGEAMEGVTAQDILASTSTLGIDIGEGTVNFPVFKGGLFNADASQSYNQGYGTVLERSLEHLKTMNIEFKSRKALNEALLTPITGLNKNRLTKIRSVVETETRGFVMEVLNEFKKMMGGIGSYVEVIYVYGGGANAVKEFLYPELIKASKSFGGEDISFPILYLDSNYSRYLNREGMYIIAEQVAAADAAKTAQNQQK